MKLYAMFEMVLQRGDAATDEMATHLRNHTILSLNIKKLILTVGRPNVPAEMFKQYAESSIRLGELLTKCFNETTVVKMVDCKWDTNDVLTTEEEAALTAPAG